MKAQTLFSPLVLSLALAACGKDQPDQSAAPANAATPATAMEQGQADAGAPITANMGAYDIYSAKCVSCHGDVGQGVGDNPKLIGLTAADIDARLKDYRDGKTLGSKTAIMAPMVKDFTDDQIAEMARYLAS